MADPHLASDTDGAVDLGELSRAAGAVLAAAARYEAARAALLAHGDGLSEQPPLLARLSRAAADTSGAAAHLRYLADLGQGSMPMPAPMPPTRRQAILVRAGTIADLRALFDGMQTPDREIDAARDGAMPHETLDDLRAALREGRDALRALAAAHAAVTGAVTDAATDAATGAARPDAGPSQSHDHAPKEDDTMPTSAFAGHGSDTTMALADAVSRLQGGGGGGVSAPAGDVYGAFDRMLAQRLGLTLGLPDLTGDAGRAQSPSDLLARLQAGLSRAVIRSVDRGETRFRFDPLKARGSMDPAGGLASGAQAIVLQTVRGLRAPFVAALASIGSERRGGPSAEADDLRAAAMRGFDALAGEAGAATGPFGPQVDVIARQVALDVLGLAALGDVIERSMLDRLHLGDSRFDEGGDDAEDAGDNPDWSFWDILNDKGELCAVAALILPDGDPVAGVLRDPDLGFLAPEANEAALVAALGHLRVVYQLMKRDGGGGAILGRVRSQNDALAVLAGDMPTILSGAGFGIGDQAAIRVGAAADGGARAGQQIDLPRFLSWVAGAAIEDRATLTRPDLNRTDLARVLRLRQAQEGLAATLAQGPLPGIPANPYAAGRRELGEMSRLLSHMVADLGHLLGRSPPRERSRDSRAAG